MLRPRCFGPFGARGRVVGRPGVLCAAIVALGSLLVGCDAPAADLREWRPSDHDHTDKPGFGQVSAEEAAEGRSFHGVTEVILMAWKQNCIRCHGTLGRGDGPQAAMFKVSDLSLPELQEQRTDAALKAVIVSGRGSMPAFNLPDPTLEGLVRLIRLLRREPASDAGAGEAGDAAPGAGAKAQDAGAEETTETVSGAGAKTRDESPEVAPKSPGQGASRVRDAAPATPPTAGDAASGSVTQDE